MNHKESMRLKHKIIGGFFICAIIIGLSIIVEYYYLNNIQKTSIDITKDVSREIGKQGIEIKKMLLLRTLIDHVVNVKDIEELELHTGSINLKEFKTFAVVDSLNDLISNKSEYLKAIEAIRKKMKNCSQALQNVNKKMLEIADEASFDAEIAIEDSLSEIKQKVTLGSDIDQGLNKLSKTAVNVLLTVKSTLNVRAYCNELDALVSQAFVVSDTAVINVFKGKIQTLLSNVQKELNNLNNIKKTNEISNQLTNLNWLIMDTLKVKMNTISTLASLNSGSTRLRDKLLENNKKIINDSNELKKRAEKKLSLIENHVSKMKNFLLFIGFGAFIVSFFVGSYVSKSMAALLDSLKSKFQETFNVILEGELEKSADKSGIDPDFIPVIEGINKISGVFLTHINSFSVPLIIMDLKKTIKFANSAALELIGTSKEMIIGQKCYDVIASNHCKQAECSFDKALNDGTIEYGETIIQRGEERTEISYSTVPVKDSKNNIVAIVEIIVDQTKIKTVQRNAAEIASKLSSSANELTSVSQNLLNGSKEMSERAENVSKTTDEMSFTITGMASAAEEISYNISSISSSAVQMSQNMNVVSEAISAITDSIDSVSLQSVEAANVAANAMEMSNNATSTMNNLGEAALEIGKVTEVIKRIAEQTNLLALNATIEAASAGEAGRGFAVVAKEIKELAHQSAKAAEDIATRIMGVQGNTEEAIVVICNVAGIISTINQAVDVIKSAVDHQNKASNEIMTNVADANLGASNIASSIAEVAKGTTDMSKNVGEAAHGATEVAKDIQEVSEAAFRESASAQQLNTSAVALAKVAQELMETVSD